MRALSGRGRPLVLGLACAAIVLAVVLLLAGGCRKAPEQKVMYHCPMHPSYISDKPGDCPICGMRLVPIEAKGGAPAPSRGQAPPPGAPAESTSAAAPSATTPAPAPAAPAGGGSADRRILYYRSPMNPQVTSPTPAKDEMGMDFVPVYAEEAGAGAAAGGAVPGRAPVSATAEGLRLAGVQTAVAVDERLARTVRAVGMVRADERRVERVQTRVAGWIQSLAVNFAGQMVRKGDPILTFYSPELLASQEELLRARASAAQFATSPVEEVRRGADDLLAAARRRLELLDVPQSFIAELERTGKARHDVTLVAPVSGYVTAKEVYAGQQVEPGMELFTVTDLGSVWVEAQLYEYEAPLVRAGQAASITLPYDPAYAREGKVAYVYPYLDEATRTLAVRLDVPNPDLALKPGMYANVSLDLEAGEGVVIPDDAVMSTGQRQLVYVERSPGLFDPRVVRTGLRSDGRVQILSGVAAGERVVTRANFLLDSESRLRAAISGADSAREAASAPAPGGAGQGGGAK